MSIAGSGLADLLNATTHHEIGSQHPGAHADIVIVDRDRLTSDLDDLPATAVLSTTTAGRTVRSAAQ